MLISGAFYLVVIFFSVEAIIVLLINMLAVPPAFERLIRQNSNRLSKKPETQEPSI
jgi:hypothetical protein